MPPFVPSVAHRHVQKKKSPSSKKQPEFSADLGEKKIADNLISSLQKTPKAIITQTHRNGYKPITEEQRQKPHKVADWSVLKCKMPKIDEAHLYNNPREQLFKWCGI